MWPKSPREAGVETIERFFGAESAEEIRSDYRPADLILGNNVFAHAPDTNDFVAGAKILLAPEGRVVFEFPYALDFLEKSEFDTIYHEHVFYFSLTALNPLFARHGLTVTDVERLPIHGGSLRLTARHTGVEQPSENVTELLKEETEAGLTDLPSYREFGETVTRINEDLTSLLAELKNAGKSIGAYGASAKGSTLLNYCGIGTDTLDFVVDRSDYKQGEIFPRPTPAYSGSRSPCRKTARLCTAPNLEFCCRNSGTTESLHRCRWEIHRPDSPSEGPGLIDHGIQPGKILSEVILVTLEPRGDHRGSFTRTYCETEFRDAGLPTHWVQCNHTITEKKGTIRGMHWQAEPKRRRQIDPLFGGNGF